MDPYEQRALRNCHHDLLRDIEPHSGFLFKLQTDNVITESQRLEIEHEETRRAKVGKLLDILPRRGPNAFKDFGKKLKPEFPWLTDKLERELIKERTTVVRDLSNRLLKVTNEQLCYLLYGYSRCIVSMYTHPLSVINRIGELLQKLQENCHNSLNIAPDDTSVREMSLPGLIHANVTPLQDMIQKLQLELSEAKQQKNTDETAEKATEKKSTVANKSKKLQREITRLKKDISKIKDSNKKLENSIKSKDRRLNELAKENSDIKVKLSELERLQHSMLQNCNGQFTAISELF